MNKHQQEICRTLGLALINNALVNHHDEIGRQNGPQRDGKIRAVFLEAIEANVFGFSGIYVAPQFLHDLAQDIASKVGCKVVTP